MTATYYDSRTEVIQRMRAVEGKTYGEIADYLGVTRQRVQQICKAHGFRLPPNYCLACGRELPHPPRGAPKKFCDRACRTDYYTHPCAACGEPCGEDAVICVKCFRTAQHDPYQRLDHHSGCENFYSDEAIYEGIRQCAAEVGNTYSTHYATWRDAQDFPVASVPTIINRWGSWVNCVHAAGLTAVSYGKGTHYAWTPERCLQAVLKCQDELGFLPSHDKYDRWQAPFGGEYPSGATVRKRLGGWKGATRAALERLGNTTEASSDNHHSQ